MQCICVLWKGKDEQGIKLANQICRWIDEMISVEIDIKTIGNGCTVCKWQTKQEWHNSVIISTMPSRMQQETKLLHSNITTKYMAVIYSRCLTNYEHLTMAKSHNSRFKQAWQSAKEIRFRDLVKLLDMIETASGSNIQSTKSTCYRNLTKQNKAW